MEIHKLCEKLLQKKLPDIPVDIADKISSEQEISLADISNMNDILHHAELHSQAGYRRFADGSYLVSMYCPMPGITAEMIKWWFWWHPQNSERYQVWYPGAHISIGFPKKQAAYFASECCPEFQNNTHYSVEEIGGKRLPLRIDFVTPEEFGFSKSMMQENNIPIIICGHVGAFYGLVWHTKMAHIFKQTEDGLFMISRFWMGKTLKNPLLRRIILTDRLAKGMAEHCCVEYRNLLEILPELYRRR